MKPRTPSFHPTWYDPSPALARHTHLEWDVMAEVLSAPEHAYPFARSRGVSAALFYEPDMLILWKACERHHAGGQVDVIRAAADALADAGMWGAHAGPYCWNIKTLVRFALSFTTVWMPTVTTHNITMHAKELNRVHAALNRASRLQREAQESLWLAGQAGRHLTRVTNRTAPLSNQSRRSETGSRDTREAGNVPRSQRQAVA